MRPDDTVLDAPITIGTWTPSNFDGRFRGPITLEAALADSINTASVRLLQAAGGPDAVVAVAHRLGLTDRLSDSVTLALGTAEVGVLELASAYAALFDDGLRAPPTGLAAIAADGREVTLFHPPPLRVASAEHAAEMVQMLTAVVAHGSGRAAGIAGRVVAGKTGTTQDNRDGWFVGAVNAGAGNTVIAVWLGNDDDRPMRNVTGGGLPAQLFHDIATEVHDR